MTLNPFHLELFPLCEHGSIKGNFNSCSSKTLKNDKNPTVSITFMLLKRNLADNFP